MKKLTFIIALLTGLFNEGFSQCKGIKRVADDLRGVVTWSSSVQLPVGVRRIQTATTDSLFVVCQINNDFPTPQTQGLYIAFTDSTYYRDEAQKSTLNFVRQKFYYTGFVPLMNDSLKQLFLTKNISRFAIGKYQRNVNKFQAEALRRYLECLSQQAPK